MPKIPLYNEQSSIGTAQGVTINPQYAVNLASAQSQNDEIRVFQDVLGMGKEFIKEYKKNKYDSDMAKSKEIEAQFQSDAKTAWIQAKTKGQTATQFKNDGLAKLKEKYDYRYSEAGFFGDSLVDARENFNIKYAEEESSVDLTIANEALAKQVQHYEDAIYTAIEQKDSVALEQNMKSLENIKGKDYAEQIASEQRTLNFLEKQEREQDLEEFNNNYDDAVTARTRAVNRVETVGEQIKAYQEQTEIFNDKIDKLIELNPKYTEELEQLRKDFARQGRNDILFGTIATNGQERAKKAEEANLITELDKLNGETDLARRNTNLPRVQEINAILHRDDKQAELDANREYEQEGQYVTAHSILSTTSNYDEFNTEWAKVEQANKEGRYTAAQYAQLQVLKRAADNREHQRIYLDPLKSIQDNPENWTEQKINDLDGISEEQRQTMQSVYKLTLTESLYKTDADSAKHYAAVNQSIFEMQQEVLKGHYFKLYTEAKTDKEREEITKEANSRGVTISRPDMAAFGNVTEQVDKILKEIYKENDDDGFVLPKNLIIDLTQNLYSIAGSEQTYTSGNNPVGVYEHRMYKAFNEIIMPTIGSMGSNEAQINAIAHMREQMAMRVQEHLGKAPKPPYRVSPNVYGVTRIDTTQPSPTFSDATNERIIAYQKATEEWKQSDDGIKEFLHISLYPMISRLALEGLQAQTRNQIANNLRAIADEAYRSVRNDPIVGQKFYGQ